MNKKTRDATEFLWQTIRPHLPTKKHQTCPSAGSFTTLGAVKVPPDIGKQLELGPKFSFEPVLSPPELVTLAKNVADKAVEVDRPRCISECVDVLQPQRKRGQVGLFNTIVNFMVGKELRVMLSDKEGQFVVLPTGMFNEKASVAIHKNFRQVKIDLKKTREKAKYLCDHLALNQLSGRVGKAERTHLEVFFSAKTHKDACPFRAIVSEKGSWQRQVATYLQKQLSSLKIKDPYRVSNSEDLVEFLQGSCLGKREAFSIDVEDLYYSLPHNRMLESVKRCIEDNGEVAFRSSSGITLESFMEMLQFYLQSMIITWKGNSYRQKSGVCIGSCVEPVLSDIYLGEVDCGIASELGDTFVSKVFRYVDDFLVILKKGVLLDTVREQVMSVFKTCGGGLRFTFEIPNENVLQYLDISLCLEDDHVCWTYKPRSKKAILDYNSAHSKIIKRGIALSSLQSALNKSCLHTIGESFKSQTARLQKAGYPSALLSDIASTIIRKVNGIQNTKRSVERKRPVVIPYVHKISHNLKNVGNRYGVPVVFSAPQKMSQICLRVNAKAEGSLKNRCSKKHAKPFVPCATGVVYNIPLSCGRSYIGQTGRCLNDRLREHDYSLRATVGGNFSLHCKECLCEPSFDATTVMGRHRDKTTRKVLEAFYIHSGGASCISTPSVSLSNKEL
ncbi:uncharacterized protein LOC120837464, partial [Ixodes scapularis]|uniref:uncharacterized protein LOC120837464 n=1 Tax=Ixodes scapularis TaxID=6945 RepID=UPI001A9DEE97